MAAEGGWRTLVHGGLVLPADPGPAAAFFRATTPGAYTTTRTLDGGSSLLLWDRHMARLSESLQLLHTADPQLYPSLGVATDVKRLVEPSVAQSLAKALKLRRSEEEISLSILVCGSGSKESQSDNRACQVYVHASNYKACSKDEMLPAARVAVMGPGRKLARAKDSLWASTRQGLERVKPSDMNEIILSNNGDALLEGLITNFYVVKVRDDQDKSPRTAESQNYDGAHLSSFEVLTAPLTDGVLNGVIRKLVIEVCRETGILIREVSPSWSGRHTWREAFVTNGLRILQPVTSIRMPASWPHDMYPTQFQEIDWQAYNLEMCGTITRHIHSLVMDRICQLSTPVATFLQK